MGSVNIQLFLLKLGNWGQWDGLEGKVLAHESLMTWIWSLEQNVKVEEENWLMLSPHIVHINDFFKKFVNLKFKFKSHLFVTGSVTLGKSPVSLHFLICLNENETPT